MVSDRSDVGPMRKLQSITPSLLHRWPLRQRYVCASLLVNGLPVARQPCTLSSVRGAVRNASTVAASSRTT